MSYDLRTPPPSLHPVLVTNITYPNPPLPCPLIYEHYLPNSLILDPNEITPLHPHDLSIWGNSDLEAPLSSLEFEGPGGVRFTIVDAPSEVSIPTHLRYLPPISSPDGDSFGENEEFVRYIVKIPVGPPRIFYNCTSQQAERSPALRLRIDDGIYEYDLTPVRGFWGNVYLETPVPSADDAQWVGGLQTVLVWAGFFWCLWKVWKSLSRKEKILKKEDKKE